MTSGAGIVIATHRRSHLLDRVLQDLASAPLPGPVVEVLVVENGERDDTESVCGRYSSRIPVRYHHLDESGKSNALNVALGMTKGDFVIQLDDDIRVGAGTIAAYVDAARRYGQGHFFGGPVEPEYEHAPPPDWLRPWLDTSVVGWNPGAEERPHGEFLGANWAAFRSEMLAAGGYIRDLGPTSGFSTLGEEVELQKRLAAAGSRGVYLPGAGIRHFVRRDQCTLRWLQRRWRLQSLSKVLLAPTYLDAPAIAGAPRFLLRAYASQLARAVVARVVRPHSADRMRIERTLAATAGQLLGYRRVRRTGRIGASVPADHRTGGAAR